MVPESKPRRIDNGRKKIWYESVNIEKDGERHNCAALFLYIDSDAIFCFTAECRMSNIVVAISQD